MALEYMDDVRSDLDLKSLKAEIECVKDDYLVIERLGISVLI